jgi:hypothetical protein
MRLRVTASRIAAAVFSVATLLPAGLSAQSLSDDWKFQAIIYGYLPKISSSSSFPTGATSGISVNADQILRNLNFALMAWLAAQKGRWGMFTDIMYADVSGSKSATRHFSIDGIEIPAGITADLNLDVKSTLWTLGGSYRFVATPETTFDVLAGARDIALKQDLGWQFSADVGPFMGPGRQGSSSVRVNKWDAIIGAKGEFAFGDRYQWYVPYYFDVGTGQTQLTWQALAGIGYRYSWGDIIAVWRYIDYHFKSNQAFDNFSLNGPAIGVAFHW